MFSENITLNLVAFWNYSHLSPLQRAKVKPYPKSTQSRFLIFESPTTNFILFVQRRQDPNVDLRAGTIVKEDRRLFRW
jgi:hypothetical protein